MLCKTNNSGIAGGIDAQTPKYNNQNKMRAPKSADSESLAAADREVHTRAWINETHGGGRDD